MTTHSNLDLETHINISDGDHEKFAHYVDRNDATESMVYGHPIMALCGKIWVPTRSADKFPICPLCKKIYDLIPS
jgi:uncharacterized Zn-finger protein